MGEGNVQNTGDAVLLDWTVCLSTWHTVCLSIVHLSSPSY